MLINIHINISMWRKIKSFFTFRCCKRETLSLYNTIEQIGEGSTSLVFKTQNISNYKFYTCKRFHKNKIEYAQREAHIIRRMNNKYLPKFHKLHMGKNFSYLFTDYIYGEDLFDFFTKNKHGIIKTEDDLRQIARQMLFCVNTCHKINIQHLDIKLENFIVTNYKPVQIKIIDFGHAHYFFNNYRTPLYFATGTKGYTAPEIRNSEYTSTSDIWSLGVCIWILATGKMPFLFDAKIKRYPNEFPTHKHMKKMKTMPPLLRDIFCSIFQSCPEKRITMAQLIRHKWFG
jgi:serine/threonine protein kinase